MSAGSYKHLTTGTYNNELLFCFEFYEGLLAELQGIFNDLLGC